MFVLLYAIADVLVRLIEGDITIQEYIRGRSECPWLSRI